FPASLYRYTPGANGSCATWSRSSMRGGLISLYGAVESKHGPLDRGARRGRDRDGAGRTAEKTRDRAFQARDRLQGRDPSRRRRRARDNRILVQPAPVGEGRRRGESIPEAR